MTGISVGFTIVTPGSLDPDMHFDLEVKWLRGINQCKPMHVFSIPVFGEGISCILYASVICLFFLAGMPPPPPMPRPPPPAPPSSSSDDNMATSNSQNSQQPPPPQNMMLPPPRPPPGKLNVTLVVMVTSANFGTHIWSAWS